METGFTGVVKVVPSTNVNSLGVRPPVVLNVNDWIPSGTASLTTVIEPGRLLALKVQMTLAALLTTTLIPPLMGVTLPPVQVMPVLLQPTGRVRVTS